MNSIVKSLHGTDGRTVEIEMIETDNMLQFRSNKSIVMDFSHKSRRDINGLRFTDGKFAGIPIETSMTVLGQWSVRSTIVAAGEDGKKLVDAIGELFKEELLDFAQKGTTLDRKVLELLGDSHKPSMSFFYAEER